MFADLAAAANKEQKLVYFMKMRRRHRMGRLLDEKPLRQPIVVFLISFDIGSTLGLHTDIAAQKILLSVNIDRAAIAARFRRRNCMHH